MTFTIEIFERLAPVLVILLALIPFLYDRLYLKNTANPKLGNDYGIILYLIALVVIACALIVLPGVRLMSADTSDRSLFICAILLIACIDQVLNLMPVRARLQFDLPELLLYSTLLISSVPLLWEASRHLIPLQISSNQGIMRALEISLMLTMVVLCVSGGFVKKAKPKQN